MDVPSFPTDEQAMQLQGVVSEAPSGKGALNITGKREKPAAYAAGSEYAEEHSSYFASAAPTYTSPSF